MLRIYEVALSVIRRLKKLLGLVDRRDPDLARQIRRAASSVVLNIAEGSCSQGKNRNARYFNAWGSAREVRAALQVALGFGYIESIDDALADELERIIATLINLVV